MPKHRKPARWPRCAVISAAPVLALSLAAPAYAGDGVPPRWEDVVACESGGNPNAVNPYSGAAGLYQFMPGTWDAYAPAGFPASPLGATAHQQLVVAEAVLAAQGPSAWVCPGAPGSSTDVSSNPASTNTTPSTPNPPVEEGHGRGSERTVDLRQGYDGTCDGTDLYWDSCDPWDLGESSGNSSSSFSSPALYYDQGVAIKDLDGDGDGDATVCAGNQEEYENCD